MQCNIDRRGRLARLIWGVGMVIAALLVALTTWNGSIGPWAWSLTAVLAGLGCFGIFESRRGWCAVRAMGFRTPL
ncbi:MAG: hypothetical protein OER86_00555 [Phycisphaerae bacterium]|nr:hypothetical protein [Phycisphaerae bacterium]